VVVSQRQLLCLELLCLCTSNQPFVAVLFFMHIHVRLLQVIGAYVGIATVGVFAIWYTQDVVPGIHSRRTGTPL